MLDAGSTMGKHGKDIIPTLRICNPEKKQTVLKKINSVLRIKIVLYRYTARETKLD